MAGYSGDDRFELAAGGRAGRRQGTLGGRGCVASSAPLDQYIVEHPDYFFGRSPEHAYINPRISRSCWRISSARRSNCPSRDGREVRIRTNRRSLPVSGRSGFLHHSAGAWHWTSDTYPADATSLRSVASDNFVVVDTTGEPA